MQVPCKMQSAMHNDAKKQIFLDFLNKNEIERKRMILPPLDSASTMALTQSTKVKEI